MDNQTLILIGMFLLAILYMLTLYHMAHGNEREAVERGAKIALDALRRDGQIASEGEPRVDTSKAVNIDEGFEDIEEDNPLDNIIVARSQQHAEQIGDRLNQELMDDMDVKV